MGSEVSPPRPGPGPCPVTHGLPNLQPQQEPALGSFGLSSSEAISGQSQHRDEQWGRWGGEPGTRRGLPWPDADLWVCTAASSWTPPGPPACGPTFSPSPALPSVLWAPSRAGQASPRAGSPAHGQAGPPIGCHVGLGPRLMGYTVGWAWLDPGSSFPQGQGQHSSLLTLAGGKRPRWGWEAGIRARSTAQGRGGSWPVDMGGARGSGGGVRQRKMGSEAGWGGGGAEGPLPIPQGEAGSGLGAGHGRPMCAAWDPRLRPSGSKQGWKQLEKSRQLGSHRARLEGRLLTAGAAAGVCV